MPTKKFLVTVDVDNSKKGRELLEKFTEYLNSADYEMRENELLYDFADYLDYLNTDLDPDDADELVVSVEEVNT